MLLEYVTGLLKILIVGAFVVGGWAATLEFRVRNHEERIGVVESDYKTDQKEIIRFMGIVDERLKNLEKTKGQ